MQTATILHPLSRTTTSTNWIRKAAQNLAQWRQDRQMRRDLGRIAQTAPHLLADAGFAPGGPANSWHRDGLRVTIHQAPDQPPQVTVTPHRPGSKKGRPRMGTALKPRRKASLISW